MEKTELSVASMATGGNLTLEGDADAGGRGQGERMMNWWRSDADVNGGG
jgi:hypothetical protein